MSTPSFVKNVLKSIGNSYASVASAGMFSDISDEFIDSGSYVVNALVSGSIYGGFPANKVSAIAGESSTGKTFFVMTTAHEFQKKHAEGLVFYFDTEGAITTEMLDNKGLDKDRFVMVPVGTLDEFKFQCIKVIDEIEKLPVDERPKVLLILDSLGNLATEKEMGDARAEKSTVDMTRGRSIRSIFRTLTLMMSRMNIPMLVTNHTYSCLTEGHRVVLSDNTTKDISEIVVGDEVMTSQGPQEVSYTCKYEDAPTIKLTLEDGTTIQCTPNHKFFDRVNNKWIAAMDITEGTDISTDVSEIHHNY